MIRLRVVAHEYSVDTTLWNLTFNETYFPIDSICEFEDGLVTSSVDEKVNQVVDKDLIARSSFSTIVFAPVSEHDQ